MIEVNLVSLKRSEMKPIKILLGKAQINSALKVISKRISADFYGNYPLFIGVLNAAYPFMTDLGREIRIAHDVDFIRVKSFEEGIKRGNSLQMISCAQAARVRDRNVIIVDTILDTGASMKFAIESLQRMSPASIHSCVLIDRKTRETMADKDRPTPDYHGLVYHGTDYLVGYGLDYNGFFRSLNFITTMKEYQRKVGAVDSFIEGRGGVIL